MAVTKPDLPDPGSGRYWVITFEEAVFRLTLRDSRGARLLEAGLAPTASFETAAQEMIDLLTHRDIIVGTYTFEETN